MTQLIGGIVLAALIASPVPSRRLNEAQLHALLACAQQIGLGLGAPVPHFDEQNIRLRYHAGQSVFNDPRGQLVQADGDNEVRIAVYGPSEQSAVIFDLFLEEEKESVVVTVGNPASFSKKGERWIAGDNPGGMATHLYMEQLLKDFSLQKPLMMPLKGLSTQQQNISCVR